jgi:hypothetical protein
MSDLLAMVMMSAAAWRVAYFIQLDKMLDGPRDSAAHWLRAEPSTWRMWVLQVVFVCPSCLTVWTAAASVALWPLLTSADWWGWGFLYAWMTVATGALVFWRIIGSGDD